ncbi:hypothetical protein BC937DRAFT_94803 [Endogone sp. FLAS-F59071]|nr:hypothetical protein BC937DRAFT_94803 [Endogone sp. FLAS-F59071]|eukprot:RUS20612.1 hypothetical protein BC937DRAFT_94803 [Endogone sp. FLAS-F59071]
MIKLPHTIHIANKNRQLERHQQATNPLLISLCSPRPGHPRITSAWSGHLRTCTCSSALP